MVHRLLRHTLLFSLVFTFSSPTYAFWGKETLFQWADSARSYITQLYEHPEDHRTAIAATVCGTGLLAVAALGAYSFWNRVNPPEQSDDFLAEPEQQSEESGAVVPGLTGDSQHQASLDSVGSDSSAEEDLPCDVDMQGQISIQEDQKRLRHEAEKRHLAEERARRAYLEQQAAEEEARQEAQLKQQEEDFLREAFGEEILPQKPAADPRSIESSDILPHPYIHDASQQTDISRNLLEGDSDNAHIDSEDERSDQRQKALKSFGEEEIEALRRISVAEEDRQLEEKQKLHEAQEAEERARLECLDRQLAAIQEDFYVRCKRAPLAEEIVDLARVLHDKSSYTKKMEGYRIATACAYVTGTPVSPEQLSNFLPQGAFEDLVVEANSKRAIRANDQIYDESDVRAGRSLTASAYGHSSEREEGSSTSSSRSPSPEARSLTQDAEQYLHSLGEGPLSWPQIIDQVTIEHFKALNSDTQHEILNYFRACLNDSNALSAQSDSRTGLFGRLKGVFSKAGGEINENEAQFKFYYRAVRNQALLAVPMHSLEQRHRMTSDKKAAIGMLLVEALHEAQEKTDAMNISASSIKYMEDDPERKLHFMVRVLKPSNGLDTGKIALFAPIHGTFANSGPYGSGTANYDNGPRLMAAAQRMADAKGVTLHVVIPNWNSKFEENSREEAACYILPLIEKWYADNRNNDIAFIDLLGHSEGNSVITLMLKGITNPELKKHIRWLSVCPTAGSDYIPVGCKARVTVWSPADALAFIASVTRFMTYRKQSNLNQYSDSLFTNISLSYNGVPENHVTAKYRACALYDVIFDIAERFRGHCELSMDVNSEHKEILVAARRGKEACLPVFDRTKKDILEQVSLLAESRYRALYPNNVNDWHEKPHDWASFVIRYPQHGAREKEDGAAEDAAIAAGGTVPNATQARFYQAAQTEARERIHYGWERETYRKPLSALLGHSPFIFKDEGRRIRDLVAEHNIDLGDYVHRILMCDELDRDRRELQKSPHSKEFISALISYFDYFAPKEGGFDTDMFRVADKRSKLYSFFFNAGAEYIGEQSSVGADDDGKPCLANNHRIFLHGLPRGNDHIIITFISENEFLVKLGRTASCGESIMGAGSSLVKSASSLYAAAVSRVLNRTPSPESQQPIFKKDPHICAVTIPEYVLQEIEQVLNERYDASHAAHKHRLMERVRLGGIPHIKQIVDCDRLPKSKGPIARLSEYNSLQLWGERPAAHRMPTFFDNQSTQETARKYLVARRMIPAVPRNSYAASSSNFR